MFNRRQKVLCYYEIQTDKKKKKNNRPDIVLKDYEKITFLLIDTLVPTDNMEVPVM